MQGVSPYRSGFLLSVMITGKDTDGLQGFTKAHVITQDSMKLVLVKESQPVDTTLLKRIPAIIKSLPGR